MERKYTKVIVNYKRKRPFDNIMGCPFWGSCSMAIMEMGTSSPPTPHSISTGGKLRVWRWYIKHSATEEAGDFSPPLFATQRFRKDKYFTNSNFLDLSAPHTFYLVVLCLYNTFLAVSVLCRVYVFCNQLHHNHFQLHFQ